LLPAILFTISTNKEKIIFTLNTALEKKFKTVSEKVDKLFSSTIEESIKKSQEILNEQAGNLILTVDKSLQRTSIDLVDSEKKMMLESEQKRIVDLTKRLSKQFEIFLVEMDYTNINYTLNEMMQDSGIVNIIIYEKEDKILFKKIRLENIKGKNLISSAISSYNKMIFNDTAHIQFINNSFNSQDVLFKTTRVGQDYFLETAKRISAGERKLGLINISFSLNEIFEKITGNKKKFLLTITDLFNLLKANTDSQNKETTLQVKEHLTQSSKIKKKRYGKVL